MEIVEQPFRGAYLVQPRVFRDPRGGFVKTFNQDLFRQLGLPCFAMAEEFWSNSAKDVLRGMHFQLPPEDHDKAVACLAGEVLDVLLDLRKGEPTFGKSWSTRLTAENGRVLLIPRGIAHGFLSLQEGSVMLYKTSTVHAPKSDAGIRWDSFGFAWPVATPILSGRDQGHPSFADFASPF